MAAITLQQAQKHLNAWLKAELEITISQSYKIGARTLTRANLNEVRNQIKFWMDKVTELEKTPGGRPRVMRAVPRDI